MISQDELRNLQVAILDIYKYFATICVDNHLSYYLHGGCMIGAVRHGGFIPWDDDMDIVMPREDYNRLIKILLGKKDLPFIFNHYSSNIFTTGSYVIKLCNPKVQYVKKCGNNSVLYDSFLSIFPLNGIPKSKFRQIIFETEVKLRYLYLRLVRSTHNGIESDKHTLGERIGIFLNKFFKIGKNVSVSQAAEKLDKCLQRYRYDLSDEVCEFSYGIAPFVWKRAYYEEPKYVTFEGIMVPAPTLYHEYLTQQYGDYMTLPPINNQIPKHIDDIIIN